MSEAEGCRSACCAAKPSPEQDRERDHNHIQNWPLKLKHNCLQCIAESGWHDLPTSPLHLAPIPTPPPTCRQLPCICHPDLPRLRPQATSHSRCAVLPTPPRLPPPDPCRPPPTRCTNPRVRPRPPTRVDWIHPSWISKNLKNARKTMQSNAGYTVVLLKKSYGDKS